MKRRLLLALVLLLPTVAVALEGYFWFTGQSGPDAAARLWVIGGRDELIVRAFVGKFPLGETLPPMAVELVLGGPDVQTVRLGATTSREGVADFSLHSNTKFTTLMLQQPAGARVAKPLVSGALELMDVGAWITAVEVRELRARPPLDDLVVEIPSNVLAVPFLSHVRVNHGDGGCYTRLSGAELVDSQTCCGSGCALYPTEHVVELEVGHTATDKLGAILLPVVPGALPVLVENERAVVFSATPRTSAHVAWITAHEVLGFAEVDLSPTVSTTTAGPPVVRAGTRVHKGSVPIPVAAARLKGRQPLWIVTSSQADFLSSATVAWPVGVATSPQHLAFVPRPKPNVFDGFAQENLELHHRAGTTRQHLATLLGGLLFGELVLMGLYVRHFRIESDRELPVNDGSALWWTVIICLGLAFLGFLGLLWWK